MCRLYAPYLACRLSRSLRESTAPSVSLTHNTNRKTALGLNGFVEAAYRNPREYISVLLHVKFCRLDQSLIFGSQYSNLAPTKETSPERVRERSSSGGLQYGGSQKERTFPIPAYYRIIGGRARHSVAPHVRCDSGGWSQWPARTPSSGRSTRPRRFPTIRRTLSKHRSNRQKRTHSGQMRIRQQTRPYPRSHSDEPFPLDTSPGVGCVSINLTTYFGESRGKVRH